MTCLQVVSLVSLEQGELAHELAAFNLTPNDKGWELVIEQAGIVKLRIYSADPICVMNAVLSDSYRGNMYALDDVWGWVKLTADQPLCHKYPYDLMVDLVTTADWEA
jgi:hypothetical protein